jgi:hypothetical protein
MRDLSRIKTPTEDRIYHRVYRVVQARYKVLKAGAMVRAAEGDRDTAPVCRPPGIALIWDVMDAKPVLMQNLYNIRGVGLGIGINYGRDLIAAVRWGKLDQKMCQALLRAAEAFK